MSFLAARKKASVELGGDRDVTLHPSRSSHEWMELPHLTVSRRRFAPGSRRPDKSIDPTQTAPVIGSFALKASSAIAMGAPPPPPGAPTMPLLLADLVAAPREALGRAQQVPITPTDHDVTLSSFRFAPDNGAGRVVAMVQLDAVAAVAIPGKWLTTDNTPADLEVIYNETTGALATTVADPDLTLLVAYLATGETPLAARIMAQTATVLIRDKINNPFGAAAGGYVLLRQALAGESTGPNWKWWMRNLAEWFPSLPDGLVIRGTLIRHDLGDGDDANRSQDEAADCFLAALKAGVPMFAEGVRLLVDGLLSFGPNEVSSRQGLIADAVRTVRRVASCLDSQQAFTTLTIPLTTEGN